jgi:hypothetical protein
MSSVSWKKSSRMVDPEDTVTKLLKKILLMNLQEWKKLCLNYLLDKSADN